MIPKRIRIILSPWIFSGMVLDLGIVFREGFASWKWLRGHSYAAATGDSKVIASRRWVPSGQCLVSGTGAEGNLDGSMIRGSNGRW
ncbi:hypothetical protein [Paenibacillus silviterrae]|uniref:hypothetical protein n=1 Tax=Paenibacillus silviterrae TaxID=3242194 RepID=UPI002543A9C5|nr:hypothetical protein [Paenibacillus chinjuensis]